MEMEIFMLLCTVSGHREPVQCPESCPVAPFGSSGPETGQVSGVRCRSGH